MQSRKPFVHRYFRILPLSLLLLIAFFAGAVFLFAYISHEVLGEKEEAVDQYIFSFLAGHVVNSATTPFMAGVTWFASALFLQIAYGLLMLYHLVTRKMLRALEIGVVGLGGFVVTYFMKLSYHRVRPPYPLIEPISNFSFPSGHATSGFIFYGLLVYLIWKTPMHQAYKYTMGTVLILFALIIGFSRVYLRMHYPTDVVAGFCIGVAWLSVSIGLMERLTKRITHEVVPQDKKSPGA